MVLKFHDRIILEVIYLLNLMKKFNFHQRKEKVFYTNQTNHLDQDQDHSKISQDCYLEYMVEFLLDTIFQLIVNLQLILPNRKNET